MSSQPPSSPLPQQCHDRRPQKCRRYHERQPLTVPRPPRIEQKISRQQLHQSSIDQDPRAHRVQHPAHHIGSEGIRVVRCSQPESDSDGDRGGQAVRGAEDPRKPRSGRKGDSGHAGADAETFEGLMEDKDDIQGAEFVADDAEIEANDDGVEYDAEF